MDGKNCHKCQYSKVSGTTTRTGRKFWFYCEKNDTEGDRPSALEKKYFQITGNRCPYFDR